MPNKKLEAHRPGKETRYKGYWLTKFVDFFPVLGFLAIVLVFGIATKGKMFRWFNIKTIWKQSFLYIVGGLGVIFCYAQGVHDFSLAANIALSAIIGNMIGGQNLVLTVVATIAVGAAVGSLNGILYATTGLSDFILTLCVNFLISGSLVTLMNGKVYLEGCKPLLALNGQSFETIVIIAATLIVTYIFNFHC